MTEEELDEMIRVVRQDAGLIKVFMKDEGVHTDLRPILIEQMKEHKRVIAELAESRKEAKDLNERLTRVANREW